MPKINFNAAIMIRTVAVALPALLIMCQSAPPAMAASPSFSAAAIELSPAAAVAKIDDAD